MTWHECLSLILICELVWTLAYLLGPFAWLALSGGRWTMLGTWALIGVPIAAWFLFLKVFP